MTTQQIITTILYTVTTAIILPLITLLGKRLIELIGSKTHNEKTAHYLEQAITIVENAVKSVMQTYVNVLKNSGNWDDKTQKEAFRRCKEIIEKQLTPEIKEYLSNIIKDLDVWIDSQIESTIHTIKVAAA